MHLARIVTLLGAAIAASAHPSNELLQRGAPPSGCSAFSKTCYNTALRHQVRSYCTETLYPTSTVTTTHVQPTVSYTTTTVTPSPSTKLVPAKKTRTITSTSTSTATTSITITSTTYVPPSSCTGSAASPDLHQRDTAKCIASYTASSQYSSACSCLGLTKIDTTTVVISTTDTEQGTKTSTAKASTVTSTTTSTVTVPASTVVTQTSTSTIVAATATVSGFALEYDGHYGRTDYSSINLLDQSIESNDGELIAFTLNQDNVLTALNTYVAGRVAQTDTGASGDFIYMESPGAVSGFTDVTCQISDSCLLQCSAGQYNSDFLSNAQNEQGLWIIAISSGTGPDSDPFPGPSVVPFPSGTS